MGIGFQELLTFAVLLGVYFIPYFVASGREHPHRTAIFMLNLFLGWTLLGWVGALIWAFVSPAKTAAPLADSDQPGTKQCPFCAESIKAEAIICRFCSRELPAAKKDESSDEDSRFENWLESQSPPIRHPTRNERAELRAAFDYRRKAGEI